VHEVTFNSQIWNKQGFQGKEFNLCFLTGRRTGKFEFGTDRR